LGDKFTGMLIFGETEWPESTATRPKPNLRQQSRAAVNNKAPPAAGQKGLLKMEV
jgi:hypothetical protein